MRLKINLKAKKDFKIPFNYNHILSAIIYNKIADMDLAQKLHSSNSFKFFNFSQINVPNRKIDKEGIHSLDGNINFLLSSPDNTLLKNLVEGFVDDFEVKFLNEPLHVEKIEVLRTPNFATTSEFKTLSPIIIRSKEKNEGAIKVRDLAPSDKFFKGIETNLVKKYLQFNGLREKNLQIKIYSEMSNVKRKRIAINKGSKTTYHRAYMMDIVLEGDIELINFAYDCGLGEKNSMGFGMINLINSKINQLN